MSLTGTGFLVLVLLFGAGAFAAVVVGWPLLSRNRPVSIIGRTAAIAGVNVLVLFAAAVILNDQYLFFADWTDLHGALFGGGTVATTRAGTAASSAANVALPQIIATTPGHQLVLPAGAKATDRVLRFSVAGDKSRLVGEVLVTLPDGYFDPANRSRTYPVLETFPGYPGDPLQWSDSMGLGTALDHEMAAHAIGAVITVSPITEFPGGIDTECVNGPGSAPQVETWVSSDVPTWVRSTFRVRSARTSWATIGLSAGAYCSAMAAMLHPAQYAAGIAMGGYFSPEFSAGYHPFSPQSAAGRHYDLVAIASHHPPPIALWVGTSHSDSISYPSSSRLLRLARSPLAVEAVVLSHAGHRLSVWRAQLDAALSWLGRNISGFAA